MSSHPHQSLYQSQKFYFFTTNEKGKVLWANSNAEKIIGDKIELGGIILSANAPQLQKIIHNNATIIDWEVLPFLNAAGEYNFDWIAEKKETDSPLPNVEKLQLLAKLVEQTSDVLTAADLNFIPTYWNKAAEEVYGISAHEIIGKDIRDYLNISYPGITKEEVRKIILEKGEWRGEMCFNRATDKKFITLLVNFKLLQDDQNNKFGYIISGIDISAIKEAEFRLKESESRFKDVADSAPVFIWMCDADNKLLYLNKTLLDFTGVNEEYCSDFWSSLIHPDDAEKALEVFKSHIGKRIPLKQIFRFKEASGKFYWVQCSGIPRFLKDGTYIGYIGSTVDINETKINEEQLHYQATVLENVLDLIVTTDLNFKIKSLNKIAEEYYGFTKEEAHNKTLIDLISYDYGDISREDAITSLQAKGEWKGEVSFINKKNERVFLLATVTYVLNSEGRKIGVMAVSRDITDRKIIEEKLKKSEAFYRSLIADSLDGMILADEKGKITFVSPPVKNILGYEFDEVVGKNTLDFVHPEDISLAGESFQKEVSESPEIKFIVVRLLKKSGEWLWCMVRGHNQLSNPYIRSMIVYFHDDTLRKQATQALKESEQRFKKIISNLQFGVVMQDRYAKVLMCNKTILEIFNLQDDKRLIGRSVAEVLEFITTEEGLPADEKDIPLNKAIAELKPIRNVVLGIGITGSKEKKWILVSSDPVVDEWGNLLHVICTISDITERKKLEQQLIREKVNHQKLLTQASIEGQENERKEIGKELHDNIGQQLTTTKLFLEIAKSTADDSTAEMVNLALKGISDVINEVRGISRALVPYTLGDLGLIDSLNDLIETLLRSQRIAIDLDYFNFDEDAVAESQKLMIFRVIQEQLNNIVKHANATQVNIVLRNNEKDLELEIKDDGGGFDIKKIKKGLGLINIKNRVEVFDGNLNVLAAPGKGCTISIQIPTIMQHLS